MENEKLNRLRLLVGIRDKCKEFYGIESEEYLFLDMLIDEECETMTQAVPRETTN